MNRRDELSGNLAAVECRIESACAASGRSRDDITLIVITKTYPASDIDLLAELGIGNVGENRHPEAANKHAEVTREMTWHFVGGLQTNKAAAVARYADVVHSVDRLKLVASLDQGAGRVERTIDCLVQVSLSDDEGRAGALPDEALRVADAIAGTPHLRLRGVMAVAPLGAEPDRAFAGLVEVSTRIAAQHPCARHISAGMSADLEQAISGGATHLRIGRSVLGARAPTG